MEHILDVIVNTPLGDYPATLTLKEEEGSLHGTLSMLGRSHSFSNGTLQDGAIMLSMAPKTPLGTIAFKATGTFQNGVLDVSTKTRLGKFRIYTKR